MKSSASCFPISADGSPIAPTWKTRVDLLAAAERVISKKSYHRTRIADIASEADVGLGTFYLRFKTKNEIFIEHTSLALDELKELTALGGLERAVARAAR